MARDTQEIKNQMIATKDSEPSLSSLNSPSKTAVWNLIFFIVAQAINIFEQLLDLFKSDMEKIAASSIPGTEAWVRQKVFQFQYSATTPQVVQLINLVPTYPNVDETLRVVTRCSVTTEANREVTIKVAKNNPPEKLDLNELNALKSYVSVWGNAGIQYTVSSNDPDRIGIEVDVYFNSQYSTLIKDLVINAVSDYIKNVDFSATIYLAKIEDAIQSVDGVIDVKIKEVSTRPATIAYTDRDLIYSLITGVNDRSFIPYSGYVIPEDTASHTFLDSFNFIAS